MKIRKKNKKLLRVPGTARRSNKSNPKEINADYSLERLDAETLILWLHDEKGWLIGKDPDAGKDWRQEEKGVTEDEMVGWHHQLKGHEFEQTLGDSEGQASLLCCSPWGRKKPDTTKQLNDKRPEWKRKLTSKQKNQQTQTMVLRNHHKMEKKEKGEGGGNLPFTWIKRG